MIDMAAHYAEADEDKMAKATSIFDKARKPLSAPAE
jgi:hypothetical protein